jgi:hypothetical protein
MFHPFNGRDGFEEPPAPKLEDVLVKPTSALIAAVREVAQESTWERACEAFGLPPDFLE